MAIDIDVFGLAPETEGMTYLKDRRRHYGDKHGIKVEAVADREESAMDSLRKPLKKTMVCSLI